MEPFTLEPPPEHITREDRRRALERRAREISGDSVLFNEASWQLVLDMIEDGFTIEEINDNPDLPSWSTIRRWIRSSPEREDQYKASRDLSADMLESQLMGLVRYVTDKDDVPAAKLQADTLKWIIPRRSRRYMDKVGQELSGPNGAALNPPTLVIAPYEPDSPDKD